jgi:putative DNA primase/helicase
MLNHETGEVKPHDEDYYATYQLNVEYYPENTNIPRRWIEFLEETIQTPAAIAQVQEFMGLCFTRNSKFAKCLLLIGPGADGKSLFIKMLRKLVGIENCSSVSFQDLEDQFHRSSLYNKFLNISTEIGSKAMESTYFKAISAGDPINAAFKHQNPFDFIPFCKLIFATNKLPRVLDNSDGFFRRVLPVQFKRQFLNDADVDLEEKLDAEISGIFEWALVGGHRLIENGKFTECDETKELMHSYRRLNNPVQCFVEDECMLGAEANIEKKELLTSYREYCKENNYKPMHRENFFRELYAVLSNVKTTKLTIEGTRTPCITGISLKPTVEA